MSSISEEILNELQEVSPAIAIPGRNTVYSVPLNYFDNLAGNILQHVKENIAGQKFVSTMPFQVPGGYFDGLAGNILAAVKADQGSEIEAELSGIAPLLNTISRQNVYQVPVGYFNDFAVQPLVEKQQQGKVKSLSSYRSSLRYAAAAAVAGLIGVSAWLFAPTSNKSAGIDTAATINVAAAVNKLSDDEIIDYLSENSFAPDVPTPQSLPDAEVDINQVLQNISAEEIRDYLKQYDEPKKEKQKQG